MDKRTLHIGDLLSTALQEARSQEVNELNLQRCNHARSRRWIERLAHAFTHARSAGHFADSVRVFWRTDEPDRDCRAEFGLGEFLYDINVCDTELVAAGKRKIRYVREALWAVECEFKKDRRHAILDFSKLVLSAAPDKLFVGPHIDDEPAYLETLRAPARACGGRVWLAIMPHPGEWNDAGWTDADAMSLWRLDRNEWVDQPVGVPALH